MNASERETEVWRGTPSQVENLPRYLGIAFILVVITGGALLLDPVPGSPTQTVARAGLALAYVVAVLAALVRFLRTRSTRYRVTTERLQIATGLFSTREDDVELRRVRDLGVERPVLLRMFGRGHVVITSADPSAPRVVLRAIPDPQGVRDRIRAAVDRQIQARGVRMVEYD